MDARTISAERIGIKTIRAPRSRKKRDVETIDGVARRNHDAAERIEREPDQGPALDQELPLHRPVEQDAIETTGAGKSIDDIQGALRIECDSLRPAEVAAERFDAAGW